MLLPKFLFVILCGFTWPCFGHSGHQSSGLVQYCKDDDFCFAQTAFTNPATGGNDLYLTLQIYGFDASTTGWTALGLGTAMEGALMFVIYGNPKSQEKPTLSIRTTKEKHHSPLPFTPDDANGAEIQLVYAKWTQVENSYRADVNIICYNCTRWPGTTIDVDAKEQPWIWAHNPDQEGFDAHAEDALLQMHPKDSSGFGFFYVNMAMSTTESDTPPDFPEIDADKGDIGAAADSKGVASATGASKSSFRHRAWQVHGFLLAIAYLVLYPLGVVLLRQQTQNSFKLHWIFQLVATVLSLLGMLLGVYLHPEIEHVHQVIGIVLCVAPLLQSFLGWRHHVIFMQSGRRTMFSSTHITLGRLSLVAGAINIILGMVLKHWGAFYMVGIAAIVVIEAAALGIFILKKGKHQKGQRYAQLHSTDDQEGVFALDDVVTPVSEDDDGSEKDFETTGKRHRFNDE